ncbi:LysR family substrate-binding domain-containing protein [Salinibacterium sp. ZJ450]|uniref:LysR family substrate-binding domain-containing protein n=1 Tax=Salinibacterium sp. ZJ450 TaxID=2708338 RepID=UPI00141D92B3|nr:LysR family substrate-binding domain-containing protein [Salinibacterium sp. ZJ450]
MPRFSLAYMPGVTPTKWVRIWKERQPEVPIELLMTDVASQVSALRDGRADMSLVRLPIDREGLNVIALYEEIPVVVLPKDHAAAESDEVTLADLANETWLEFPELTDEQRIDVVATGAGIVVVPQSIARLYARKDLTYRPVTDAETTEVALAWPVDTAADPELIEEFIGIVRGRTARSSRAVPTPPTEKPKREPAAPKTAKKKPPRRAPRQSSGAPKRKKRH